MNTSIVDVVGFDVAVVVVDAVVAADTVNVDDVVVVAGTWIVAEIEDNVVAHFGAAAAVDIAAVFYLFEIEQENGLHC